MNYLLYFTIAVIGLSGIVAQILILRELLVSFNGNELTLGIILANWLILEASGVYIMGRLVDRIKNKFNLFVVLEVIFSLSLPLFIYFSRVYKSILGIPFAEAIGLPIILSVSFLIILPLGFCHGSLFSVSCKIHSLFTKEPVHSIAKIYTWETIGTILGGIALTYLFIPYLNSFQLAFIISISNLIILFLFFKYVSNYKLKYIILFSFILVFLLNLGGGADYFQRLSVKRQWKRFEVLEYRNSIYGNIVVTREKDQYTFFYNGVPIITTPYPDITFVEEFAHLPLLFHHAPKDILIISSAAGGLINELAKHPLRKLDYAELDPLLIEMLKKYPSQLTQRELLDKRLNLINLDGRFFLRSTQKKYDLILIGLSRPADLVTNRLFTQEFFSLAKNRLNPQGILALWLPGSLAYLSQELKDLNACILNGLKNSYAYVRIIPGDYNIFLASESGRFLEVNSTLIAERLSQRNIRTNILTPAYLDYRLNKNWLEWFIRSLGGSTKEINRDLRPLAVFELLVFWNKQFSPRFAHILEFLQKLNLGDILVLIFVITAIFFYILRSNIKFVRLSLAYSIATTGFFGMLINLILIFSFQVFYGYLYHRIGILVAIFMAGIAVGSFLIAHYINSTKNGYKLFIKLEVALMMFVFFLALAVTRFSGYMQDFPLSFIALFFIPGFLMGLEFSLASKMYLDQGAHIGQTAGLLYCADLIGGWVAGIFGSIILLPILGALNTCIVMVMFKLSSLTLLTGITKKFSLTKRAI